jgi:hypothetical protein
MGRSRRWAYLGRPDHNPPNDDCPECSAPSRTYFLGSRLVPDPEGPHGFGWTERAWTCEHQHRWTVRERL